MLAWFSAEIGTTVTYSTLARESQILVQHSCDLHQQSLRKVVKVDAEQSQIQRLMTGTDSALSSPTNYSKGKGLPLRAVRITMARKYGFTVT